MQTGASRAPRDLSAILDGTVSVAGCPDATIRDSGKALEAAQQAHALAKGPAEIGALAAAHAELGHFDMAALWQEKAIATAPAGAKEENRDRLKKY